MAHATANRPDDRYRGVLESLDFQPIFVLGPHRSGTTILYRLLAESGRFNVATVYHILNRHRLLSLREEGREEQAQADLMALFREKGLETRVIDALPASPNLLEEYAFALEPAENWPMLKPKHMSGFTSFCKKLQYLQDPKRRLLLKNPCDTENFIYLNQEFPNAKFIFMHRAPEETIGSQMRAWAAMLFERSEYHLLISKPYRWLYEHQWALKFVQWMYTEKRSFRRTLARIERITRYMLRNCDILSEKCAHVTYAGLCDNPNGTVLRLLDFLGESRPASMDCSALIRRRKPKVLPAVEKNMDLIRRRTAEYSSQFGV